VHAHGGGEVDRKVKVGSLPVEGVYEELCCVHVLTPRFVLVLVVVLVVEGLSSTTTSTSTTTSAKS
jgi:hypothetical protein